MENQIQERWGEATNELIKNLETHNIDFSKLNAIELFGRDGTWQTKIFANKVKTIENKIKAIEKPTFTIM